MTASVPVVGPVVKQVEVDGEQTNPSVQGSSVEQFSPSPALSTVKLAIRIAERTREVSRSGGRTDDEVGSRERGEARRGGQPTRGVAAL